jgi:hypothetical protein
VSGLWSVESAPDVPVDHQQEIRGKRLAVTNLDWDSISAVDILVLFRSFCHAIGPSATIDKVKIYPSLFGIEQMKRDSLYGPPKEIFESKRTVDESHKLDEEREFIGDDEYRLGENDDGRNLAMLRKYEINKMKYYYAIVFCNSTKTAKKIFKEYNGYELELTNIKLNLSFVDDNLTFPQEMKEEASEVPPGYSFDASKVSRALNHSTVKLSWDQNDPKRLAKLHNNYKAIMNQKDDESDDELWEYKGLIAGSSDESGSDADS